MQYESPAGGSDVGSYVDPDPATGTDGSIVRAPAIENHQRELVNLITAAGLVPARGDLTQVTQAIAALIAAGSVPNRNAIINGNFDVWQRGSAFDKLSNLYGPDRWRTLVTGAGLIDVARSTDVPDQGSAYSCLLTVDTADASLAATDVYAFVQRIEGFTAKRFKLGGASATLMALSFRVKSAVTGTYCIALRNSAQSRSYIATYTVNVANTWETKTILLLGDVTGTWLYTEGIGLELVFALAAGSNFQAAAGSWLDLTNAICTSGQVNWMATGGNTFQLDQVQLEIGSVAGVFEQRTFQQELDACGRFYTKTFPYDTPPAAGVGLSGALGGKGVTTTDAEPSSTWRFPVQMRAAPTITLLNPRAGGASGQWQVGPVGDGSNARVFTTSHGGTVIDQTGTVAVGGLQAYIHATAEAEL